VGSLCFGHGVHGRGGVLALRRHGHEARIAHLLEVLDGLLMVVGLRGQRAEGGVRGPVQFDQTFYPGRDFSSCVLDLPNPGLKILDARLDGVRRL